MKTSITFSVVLLISLFLIAGCEQELEYYEIYPVTSSEYVPDSIPSKRQTDKPKTESKVIQAPGKCPVCTRDVFFSERAYYKCLYSN